MFSNAIFDLDGTLVNTLEDLASSCNYILEKNGYPIHETEKYRHFVGDGLVMLITRILPPGTDKDTITKLHTMFGEYYGEHYCDKSTVYPGILDVIAKLKDKGIKLGVVSNKPHKYTVEIINKLFPADSFEVVFGQRDTVPKKPDPTGVFQCMELLSANADNTVYVGDSNVDVVTAKNASLKCIGVEWGFRGKEELLLAGADIIASNSNELYKYITER